MTPYRRVNRKRAWSVPQRSRLPNGENLACNRQSIHDNPWTYDLEGSSPAQARIRRRYRGDFGCLRPVWGGRGNQCQSLETRLGLEMAPTPGLELGCIFSINPDAHSTSEIDLTRWGLAMARKDGVPPERVLNALDLSSFREYVRTRKMGRSNEQAPAPMAPFGLATRLHRDETRQGHRRRSQ